MSDAARGKLKRVHDHLEAAILSWEKDGDSMPFFRVHTDRKFCKAIWQVTSFAKARPGHEFTAEFLVSLSSITRDTA